jgi:hypothetical protein
MRATIRLSQWSCNALLLPIISKPVVMRISILCYAIVF